MDKNSTIGQKIKLIRELRGYKQDFVATQIGISQNGYSKIERGESDILYNRLEKIAHVLGISTEKLVSIDLKNVICAITNDDSTINTPSSTNNQNSNISMLLERLFVLEGQMRKIKK